MTLNSCRDYSDKARAVSSNLQLLFDVYLAYGSEESFGNEKMVHPYLLTIIFPSVQLFERLKKNKSRNMILQVKGNWVKTRCCLTKEEECFKEKKHTSQYTGKRQL